MGIAEWLAEHGTGWLWVFLAAMGGVVALMLLVPWHAFARFRKAPEDRDRWVGVRRHGRRGALRRAQGEGRHRADEGGMSTWQYIDSGAWNIVSTGSAPTEAPLAGQDTTILNGRRLTPSDTEEGERDARSGAGLGARA